MQYPIRSLGVPSSPASIKTAAAIAIALAAIQTESRGAAYVWDGTTANFSNAASWDPDGVPTNLDSASINNGGTILIDSDQTFGTGNAFFSIGTTAAGTGTVTQTAGAVTNSSASGTLNLGTGAGATGTYNISGGSLVTGSGLVRIANTGTGILNASGNAVITSAGGMNIANNAGSNATIAMSDFASWTVAGATAIGQNSATAFATFTISGLASFSGAGVTLGNNNSNGVLNLNGGTFAANSIAKGSGTGIINFNGGTVQAKAAGTFFSGFAATNTLGTSELNLLAGGLSFDTNGNAVTIAQNLSGAGALRKVGAGTLTLSGTAATYSGGTTVGAGSLSVSNVGAIGTGPVTVESGATFTSSPGAGANFTQAFTIAGNGSGLGALRLGAVDAGVTLSGGLTLTADAQIGTTSSISNNITISTNAVNLGSHRLTIGAPTISSGTYTVSSNVVGTGGGITFNPMNAEAALVLTGTNTYTGTTNIVTGTFAVNGNNSAATGDVTVATGAFLRGIGTIGGNTTVSGTLDSGAAAGLIGLLTFNGNLTLNGATELAIASAGVAGVGYDAVAVLGALNYGGTLTLSLTPGTAGDFALFAFGSAPDSNHFGAVTLNGLASPVTLTRDNQLWSGTSSEGFEITFNEANGMLSVVPEPSTYVLLGAGLLALFVFKRFRRVA